MELELRLLALLAAPSPHMACLATCAVRSRPGQGGTSATDCSLFVLAWPSSTPPADFHAPAGGRFGAINFETT